MTHPSREAAATIRQQGAAMSQLIVLRQYNRQPELWQRFGDTGRSYSLRDAGYHLSYLAEALDANDDRLFVAYVQWVKVLFAGLGFPEEALLETLRCTREVMAEQLDDASGAKATIDTAQRALLQSGAELTSFISPDTSQGELARRYLERLLAGDRAGASRLVFDAVDGGLSVRELYLEVFQPTQYELGRLWQLNEISVAQEHFCSAATQVTMSQLYPRIFTGDKKDATMLGACIGGELHELGIRMVTDFFEIEGWETHYLGANTPRSGLIEAIERVKPDVLGLSATMTFHIPKIRQIIDEVRAGDGRRPKIIVGGYPFKIASQLWQSVDADGSANSAAEALILAGSFSLDQR